MQIAGVGAIEASLANLSMGVAGQQQLDQASVAQNGLRSTGVSEKREAEQAKATKASADAADIVGTQMAGQPQQSGASQAAAPSGRVEAGEALTKRELFDYLAEVERNGGANATPPSVLIQSAIGALDGTLQKINATLEKAQAAQGPAAGEGATQNAPTQAGEQQAAANQGAANPGEGSVENFALEAEHMLERSMSVMWAAANLEVVMSSVTAVTSSTSTLIKQQ